MRRSTQDPDEPLLFDLPLSREPEAAPPSEREPRQGRERPREDGGGPERVARARAARDEEPAPTNGQRALRQLELAAAPERVASPRTAAPAERGKREAAEPANSHAARGRRLLAGCADLAVHLALLVGVVGAGRAFGVRPNVNDWPGLLLFLLAFSFFYTVVPLAFWGHTLGMAWSGIVAHNRDGEPLSFDQTARRWLGGLLTLALAGLPLALAFRGRTLTDLLSGSETYPASS
jgi:uncharacterized RDD family membrane protein YckC